MDQVSQIKEKLNIVDLIGSYVPLKKTGKNYKGLCPFHKEKSPSFIVSEDLQRYRCFGCGKQGDIFNFIMDIDGLEFSEALKILGEKAGVEVSFDHKKENNDIILKINETAADFYHNLLLKHPFGKAALEYLKQRKVTTEIIQEFKLGYAPNSWDSLSKALVRKGYKPTDIDRAAVARFRKNNTDTYDLFRARLIFPLIDHMGKLAGFAGRALLADQVPKYLNTPETPVYHKERFLYGLHLARKYISEKKFVVMVEGYFDMMSLYQNGYKNVVATSGTALTPAHLALIKRYTDNITFVFDSDSAGVQAALRGIDLVQSAGLDLKIASMPKGIKDPGELMEKEPIKFHEVLEKALPIWDYYFVYASNTYNFDEIFEKKKASAFLLNVINKIADDVVKGQYIKRFVALFDVSEESVVSQLKKVSQAKDIWMPQKASQAEPENIQVKKEILSPEFYLLYLLLHAERGTLSQYINQISQDYFENADIKALFNAFMDEYSQTQKNIDIKAFYDRLPTYNPSIHKMFENIYLVDIATNLEDSTLFATEFQNTLDRVKSGFLKRNINRLAKEMKKNEAANNPDIFKKLQTEASEYINQLSKLTISR